MLREVELEDATHAVPQRWEIGLDTGQPNDTEVRTSMTGEVIEWGRHLTCNRSDA